MADTHVMATGRTRHQAFKLVTALVTRLAGCFGYNAFNAIMNQLRFALWQLRGSSHGTRLCRPPSEAVPVLKQVAAGLGFATGMPAY